jgi:predicted aminopeptidase
MLLLTGAWVSACNPLYVMRAAYEQTKILASREPISEVLADPSRSPAEREKLSLVLEAREFAIAMGLDPKESFTSFAPVDGDAVAWVLSASKKNSFELYTWWFPIVGSVPYKGYFDREDALEAARTLADKGYESWVRGTDAFSTLGWFNDPVLSTTLQRDAPQIVNTVIHESVHRTVWIPHHVAFNESLANFVGTEGAIEFFQLKRSRCEKETESDSVDLNQKCLASADENLAKAVHAREREHDISVTLERLMSDLRALYASDATLERTLKERADLFSVHITPLREKYPELRILSEINNAELLQLELYLKHLDKFERHRAVVSSSFSEAGASPSDEALSKSEQPRSWQPFIASMREIASLIESDQNLDPFSVL